MFRDEDNAMPAQHFGRYVTEGEWEIAIDAPLEADLGIDWGCPGNSINDHVLFLRDGAGSFTLPLNTPLESERQIKYLLELGTLEVQPDPENPDEEFEEPTDDPRHQLILLDAEDGVLAYAEIASEGITVNLGGEIGEDGMATNPGSTVEGPASGLGDGDFAEYTRYVLTADCSGVRLLEGLAGDYPIYRYGEINDTGVYGVLASAGGISGAVAKVAFASTGSGEEMRGVAADTLAVFHNLDAGACGTTRRPGDTNGDGAFDLSDAIAGLEFQFTGGPLPACYLVPDSDPRMLSEAGLAINDFNGDGGFDISDQTAALSYMFIGGENPPHVLGTECVTVAGSCEPLCE
jgi:hypothetical protein